MAGLSRRKLLRWILATLSVSILAEAGLRAAGFKDFLFYDPGPEGFYSLHPNQTLAPPLRPVKISINSLGLRDREKVASFSSKPEGESRFLFLGDSVLFGTGLEFEETLPALFEARASELLGRGRVRSFNGGVPGYGVFHERIWFERFGAHLAPEVAVLVFNYNDVTAPRPGRPPAWVTFPNPFRVSAVYNFLRFAWLSAVYTSNIPPFPQLRRGAFSREPGPPPPGDTTAAWRRCLAELEKLLVAAEERGVRPVVLLIPWLSQLPGGAPLPAEYASWAAVVDAPDPAAPLRDFLDDKREKITFIDLNTAFSAAPKTLYQHEDPSHLSAAGCRLAAETLLGELVSAGFFAGP